MAHSIFRPSLRFNASEAEAIETIARRAGIGLQVDTISGVSWLCCLTSGAVQSLTSQCDVCIRLEWAGAELCLCFPRQAVSVWLETRYSDVEFGRLPDQIFAAALDAMFAQWLDLLESRSNLGRPRIVELHIQEDALIQMRFPHTWTIRLEAAHRPDNVVFGILQCDGFALQLLAGLVSKLPEAVNDINVDEVPVEMAMCIGLTRLSLETMRSLECGDVVLLDHYYIDAQASLWLCADAEKGLRVRYENGHYVVTESWKTIMTDAFADEVDGYEAMSSESETDDEPISSFDDVPVTLSFDLGARSIALGELRRLQAGEVFDLQRPLNDGIVRVRANGVTIGQGELVDFDGRVGVRLLRLGSVKP